MFKTRFTDRFGVRHPIMMAGMNWVTEPNLVASVCNAGGLGILATARFGTKEEMRRNIREIRELTDKPFGINQILIGPGAKEGIEVAIEEKVPVLNYTLGRPWFIDQVHEYGGKIIGTTATVRHAVRAEELGCDAIVVTGYEAAAHGHVATSLVLISAVEKKVKIPIIAAGGYHDGRGLAAALALRADAISMGTRLSLTKESILHETMKQLCLRANVEDTLYSDRFDGMPGRVLKTRAAELFMKGKFPLIEALQGAWEVKKLLGLSLWQFMNMSLQMMRADEGSFSGGRSLWSQARQAVGFRRQTLGIYEGNVDEGMVFEGQCVGAIDDLPSVKELIDRIISEAEDTVRGMQAKLV